VALTAVVAAAHGLPSFGSGPRLPAVVHAHFAEKPVVVVVSVAVVVVAVVGRKTLTLMGVLD
jgi:hypothetical protein